MKHFISESRAQYEDMYHGQFSRALAEWAIDNMRVKDPTTGKKVAIKPTSFEEALSIMRESGVKVESAHQYTAWYLYNMAVADYAKTCKTNEQRATFVEETLYDPDCCPEAVLECFTAKMCAKGVPIYWENYM